MKESFLALFFLAVTYCAVNSKLILEENHETGLLMRRLNDIVK